MSFKSAPTQEAWRGVFVCAGLVIFTLVLIRLVFAIPVSGFSFILGLLAIACIAALIYLAYRTWSILSLEYWVDRDALTIIWGPVREIIPLGAIQRIQRGGYNHVVGQWWEWPNPFLTRRYVPGSGRILSLATRPAAEQIVVFTEQRTRQGSLTVGYALSPTAPDLFIRAIQERVELGPNRVPQLGRRWPGIWQWDLWRDRLGLTLLGISFVVCLLVFGILAFRYPALPENLPLHFDAQGIPDRFGSPSSLFVLPLIGLGALLINAIWGALVFSRQRPAAYLLWSGALLVQLLVGFALLNLIR